MTKNFDKTTNIKKKPAPFIAFGSTEPISKEEVEKFTKKISK